MPPSDAHVRLRQALGERVPEGKSDADTMFRDEEIDKLLIETSGDVDRAAHEGWRIKAANYARLVDVTEGNSQRKMSQLHVGALNMVRAYARSSTGPTEGRSRIGVIRRPVV